MAEQPPWMKPKPIQKQPMQQQRPQFQQQQRSQQYPQQRPGMLPGQGRPQNIRQPIDKRKLPSAKKKKLLRTLVYLMIFTAVIAIISGLYFYFSVIKVS